MLTIILGLFHRQSPPVLRVSLQPLTDAPYPDFQDILEIANLMYEEEEKKDDSLIEVFRDLAVFELFWKHGDEVAPIDKISNRSMLIRRIVTTD